MNQWAHLGCSGEIIFIGERDNEKTLSTVAWWRRRNAAFAIAGTAQGAPLELRGDRISRGLQTMLNEATFFQ